MPQNKQSSLATLFYESKRSKLLFSPYIASQPYPLQQRFLAILDSIKQRWASSYLYAIPNQGFKQVMTAPEFRANMALRLLIPKFSGERICSRVKCTYKMDSFGYHALCYREKLQKKDMMKWYMLSIH